MRFLPFVPAVAIALTTLAFSQPREGALTVDSVEAVVTVTKVDHAQRVVVVRGAHGDSLAISVPPEAQNLDQVSPGARFRMRYVEAMAVSIAKGGKPSADIGESVVVSPKGATPGGIVMRTLAVSGVVDAIDYDSRYITLHGPKGSGIHSYRVPDTVKNLEQINGGDRITVSYTQALALRMVSPGM